MAIGIAGDSSAVVTPALTATASLTNAAALDLLTQILIELRTNTTVTLQDQGGNRDDLNDIRADQDLEVVTGVGYGPG